MSRVPKQTMIHVAGEDNTHSTEDSSTDEEVWLASCLPLNRSATSVCSPFHCISVKPLEDIGATAAISTLGLAKDVLLVVLRSN